MNKDLFLIILYVFLTILVIVSIIFVIKLIFTLKKVDKTVDDVNMKLEKLNGLFSIIGATTDVINNFNDKLATNITNGLNSLFKKKRRGKKNGKEE